ncbi:hypothetical protein [Salinibacter ruber]|uniref:hypothetical protein n=1 Tax=Salinibacter ruber TaxID=146919 RepID=UPI00216751C7|nr:hypothetical protein [Salinibacter ruber]MCS4172833.1 hypothetical protein [Salinibacter ruber]
MMDGVRSYYFSRYGLAETLVTQFGARTVEDAEAAIQNHVLEEALEARARQLMGEVRVRFPNPEYPPNSKVEGTLVQDLNGAKGKQVGANGYFVRPHVLLGDGQLNGKNGFINKPLSGRKGDKIRQKQYPPSTKLSVGKATADNVKKTRLFALACMVTTLTPLKAARRTGDSDRGAVIPDLPLPELLSYLDLYLDLQPSLPGPTQATTNDDGKPFLLQNEGTFPDPPPGWTFGTLGVVAGIGSWARKNDFFEDAKPVLEALANRRVYVIDTSGTNRSETAGSHVATLAREGILRSALENAWKIQTNANKEDVQRVLRRWLLRFNPAYFRDFLSLRATYPRSFSPLFDAYFMPDYDPSLVSSARAAAQHINTQAYHAADGTGDTRRQNKQTILSSLESTLYDCGNGPELIARISVQVGRLTGADFPPDAQEFFDRTTAGELTLEEARNLLVAYMRLRGTASDDETTESEPQTSSGGASPEQGESEPVAEAADAESSDASSGESSGSPTDLDDAISDLP